ncbi:MAG: carboxy-S-adenosyl-L-methionine synthase CmoA [Pirellulaceae bacterium]
MAKDNIYALPHARVGDFAFDEAVADVFPDMIARSVPGYASILAMIEQLSERFALPGTNVYDLGCSLGAATWLMAKRIPASCTLHAVDNSPAMVSRLRARSEQEQAALEGACAIDVHQADVREFPLSNASFVVLNLTLQFILPAERRDVLAAVYDALLPGGALLLSEKVWFELPTVDKLLTELHHDFKRAHGYSDLEIAQKRTAIENRLIPDTLPQHEQRLGEIGFRVVAPWFQCFNFVSMLAIK